jgi:multidrug efflux pump subunit AcrA (membrane-fusion protein)
MRRRAQTPVKWVLTAAVIVAVLCAAGWGALRFIRPVVTVTEAVEGPVVEAFYATGTVLPAHEYPIKSNVAGIIEEVRVDKGDAVKKGQVLAIVLDPDLTFKSKQAEAELEEKRQLAADKTSPVLAEFDAKITAMNDILEIAKREEKRLSGLIETNAASQTDLDRAIDRMKVAWSEVESFKTQKAAKKLQLLREVQVAEAAVGSANWNLQQQTIKSPIDGTVLDRPNSIGTRVAINDHIMQIADVSPGNLVMRAAVDEEDVNKVNIGQTVRMTLYSFPGQVFEGKVDKIYNKADADRRTFEVDVRFVQEQLRLSAGMTGELAFVVAAKERAIVVPSQALQNGAIWTVSKDNQLERTTPEIGLKSVERVEVVSGITPGTRVLLAPVGSMESGQTVRPDYLDPVTAAGLNKPKVTASGFKGFN